ncbi:MAG TPA: BglII/BstYI family type II restriction endonuclease [Candidatus Dormibacteraeota bacterium]|nr:BglII/BstYI family type II restriction endonuclease [Candidatus Dormibacteraeota bacterium]
MKKLYEYSHFGGIEILQVRYPEIDHAIDIAIADTRNIQKPKARKIQRIGEFRIGLRRFGFHEMSPFIKSAFAKSRVFVAVHSEAHAFMLHDMAKFQYFYNEDKIDVGVEIIPCGNFKRKLSSGAAYCDQLIGDVLKMRRHFPVVPIKVILIDVDSAPDLGSEKFEEAAEADENA